MYRILCLIACVALCKGSAVVPLIVPPVYEIPVPIVSSFGHGHSAFGFGHGYIGKALGHHIHKRSPHLIPVDGIGHTSFVENVGHVGQLGSIVHLATIVPAAAITPVAVSHQARVDIHSSPVVAPIIPLGKGLVPILAPVHKPLPYLT